MPDHMMKNQRSNLIAAVSSGDWLAVPGAARAIFRLVGGVGELGAAAIKVGTAKLEQVESGIRDNTAAKTVLSKALARAAAKAAAEDKGLIERSIECLISKELRKQRNKDSIALKTIEQLGDDPNFSNNTEGPSDDWMNNAEAHFENASSEDMQILWGRILAGEIRRPGSFSKAALHIVSILDQRTAKSAEKIFKSVFNENLIYFGGNLARGQSYIDLNELDSLGIVKIGSANITLNDNNGKYHPLRFEAKTILVKVGTGNTVRLPLINLTSAGLQLRNLVDTKNTMDVIMEIGQELCQQDFTEVLVGDAIMSGEHAGHVENVVFLKKLEP